jgi:thiamine-phosphate pyrophosphorylase
MASRGHRHEAWRDEPRLYLITPPVSDPMRIAAALEHALGAGADIAAVLLRLAEADDATLAKRVQALNRGVQDRGVALVTHGHPAIGAEHADGAHLTGIDAFMAAYGRVKPDRIAGCGGLKTRHDAMSAAQTGADYVMFGEPAMDGYRPAFDAILERVAWWAEVFEIPCVGYAANMDEVAALVRVGADFVAVDDLVWNDARGPAAALRSIAPLLAIAEPAQ